MKEQEEEILKGTMDLVQEVGIKGLTMDEVAKHFGISKKTLYKHVSNKSDLINKAFQCMFCKTSERVHHTILESENAIDELFKLDNILSAKMKDTLPSLLHQLKRFTPKTYEWLECNKEEMITKLTVQNLKRGVEEGLYRSDIDIEIIAHLYFARISALSSGKYFTDNSFDRNKVELQNTIYHIRGIASKKGLEYLEKTLRNEKN